MYSSVSGKKIKINNLKDLKATKQKLKYEVKLHERMLAYNFSNADAILKASAKNIFKRITKKVLLLSFLKLTRKRWRK